MNTIKNKLKQQKGQVNADLFRNEAGAIDLASIMVGIIVIGLIGGVIASTVFVVIPWAQDNAAKQQLDSVASAESAYMGMSSATPSPLPAGYVANSFGNSSQLKAANLLQTGTTYCAVTPADGKSYSGYSKSASGSVWVMSDKNTQPAPLTDPVPTECGFTNPASAPAPTDPTTTSLTYKCDTATSGALPLRGITGMETWSDTATQTYSNADLPTPRTFAPGVTYTVTFKGTYQQFNAFSNITEAKNLSLCLRSVNQWGANSGATTFNYAFYNASNLTAVPASLPSTVIYATGMFQGASSFNDPNISQWDTSNLITMQGMFTNAGMFNQPLSSWHTSNVINMNEMFINASSFNQPLTTWTTTNVTNMSNMFSGASKFNQYIRNWDVRKVQYSNNFRLNSALTAANSPF